MRELRSESYDRRYRDADLVRRLAGYFRPHGRAMVLIGAAVLLMAITSAGLPLAISAGVGLVRGTRQTAVLYQLIAATLLIGIVVWALNWFWRRRLVRVIADVVVRLRVDAVQAALRQDLEFYDRVPPGRIVSRISSDTQQFGDALTLGAGLSNQLFFLVILAAILFKIQWALTLVGLAMALGIFLLARLSRHVSRHLTQQAARSTADLNAFVQESVSGIRVAKNFGQEEALYRRFLGVNEGAYAINLRRAFVLAGMNPALQILTGLALAALVYFGGLASVQGIINLAAWYLFLVTIERFWVPLTDLSAYWGQVQMALAALERVFALVDAEPSIHQVGNEPVSRLHGLIELRQVTFAYAGGEPALDDVSLRIEAGQSLALVGHSGAGKSSLTRLIARLYEFQQGAILIDGRDIRTFDLPSFRRHLGIVPQVPLLFSGSILSNLLYGSDGVRADDAAEAAHRIGGGEWLESLPDGLDTEVGDRGVQLSVGQRQLVALARVLLRGPSIFIFDEATASIDPFTELQIREAVALLMRQRTSIFIAHRLSTVRQVDRIVVLERGRIIEDGTHDGLLARNGAYFNLYQRFRLDVSLGSAGGG